MRREPFETWAATVTPSGSHKGKMITTNSKTMSGYTWKIETSHRSRWRVKRGKCVYVANLACLGGGPLLFSSPEELDGVVVIPFIMDVRLHLSVDMWTHHPGSHRRKATQPAFCSPCLTFLSREGIQPFLSLVDRKSNFVYPRHNRFPLVGHDVRDNPSSCDCAEIRTHVPTSEDFFPRTHAQGYVSLVFVNIVQKPVDEGQGC